MMQILGGSVLLLLVGLIWILWQRSAFETRIQTYITSVRELEQDSSHFGTRSLNEIDLSDLPNPVRRYLQLVLPDPLPPYQLVHIKQVGSFNFGQEPQSQDNIAWKPLQASQWVNTQKPAFIWNANIAMASLLPVKVIDQYVDGEGRLEARIWGAITVANAEQTDKLAQGELLRLLAESPWYPFLLLPDDHLRWEPENESQAWLELQAHELSVRVLVSFDDDGLIEKVESNQRYREVNGNFIQTPWSGYFQNYQTMQGILVPTQAWVQWDLESGALPYWKGSITAITYQ